MTAVAAVIGAAWAMLRAGLSMALGAFMIGLLLSDSPHRVRIEAVVLPFKVVLLGLFFISIGMGIDVSLLPEVGPRLAAHVVVLIAIKVVVLAVLCLAFGLDRADATRCALLLGQAGEFGFVLLSAAVAAGILSPHSFALAALVISTSMATTPVLAALADRIGRAHGGHESGSAATGHVY
jgi:glutathione-regulated potassium-efflux system protein KefB